jgi:hypothetical protein
MRVPDVKLPDVIKKVSSVTFEVLFHTVLYISYGSIVVPDVYFAETVNAVFVNPDGVSNVVSDIPVGLQDKMLATLVNRAAVTLPVVLSIY